MSTDSEIRTKHLGPLEIKDAEKGEVEAVVCSLNVVDHDHEVVLPGAIKNGSKIKMSSYGHSAVFGDAPVGKGVVHVDNDRAVLRAQFFMATERGREAFETVKALGSDGEWSIGFVPKTFGEMTDEWKEKGAVRLLSAIELFECSPVLRGASPNTATLAVKEAPGDHLVPQVIIVRAVKEADEGHVRTEEDDAAAKKAEAEAVEAARIAAEQVAREADEAMRLAEEQKARASDALEEYHRVQRSLQRMGLVA